MFGVAKINYIIIAYVKYYEEKSKGDVKEKKEGLTILYGRVMIEISCQPHTFLKKILVAVGRMKRL